MTLGFQDISNKIGGLLLIASGGAILWALVNHEGAVAILLVTAAWVGANGWPETSLQKFKRKLEEKKASSDDAN